MPPLLARDGGGGAMSRADDLCLCGCRRSQHKRVMRWGQASYGRCLACKYCDGQDYSDHGCGRLVPVTVTIALAVDEAR